MRLKSLHEWLYWDTKRSRDHSLADKISEFRYRYINRQILSIDDAQKSLEALVLLVKQVPIADPPEISNREQLDLREALSLKISDVYRSTTSGNLNAIINQLYKLGIEIGRYLALVSKDD